MNRSGSAENSQTGSGHGVQRQERKRRRWAKEAEVGRGRHGGRWLSRRWAELGQKLHRQGRLGWQWPVGLVGIDGMCREKSIGGGGDRGYNTMAAKFWPERGGSGYATPGLFGVLTVTSDSGKTWGRVRLTTGGAAVRRWWRSKNCGGASMYQKSAALCNNFLAKNGGTMVEDIAGCVLKD